VVCTRQMVGKPAEGRRRSSDDIVKMNLKDV
jgi:hypothetical protein